MDRDNAFSRLITAQNSLQWHGYTQNNDKNWSSTG